MFDQLPITPGAGPFDLRGGGGGLFVAAARLVENARCGVLERFLTEFTTAVGLGGSIARQFMDVSQLASGAWFIANAAWVMV